MKWQNMLEPKGKEVAQDVEAEIPWTSENTSTGIQLREAEIPGTDSRNRSRGIQLSEAWFIPGVIPYALCNFFTKLVANTFMYWLSSYIHETGIEGRSVSVSKAGIRSAVFDSRGIFGGILAGYISDGFISPASIVCSFLYCSAIASFAYYCFSLDEGHYILCTYICLGEWARWHC